MPVFFGDMTKMERPGQLDLDFISMLTLSGLWVAWQQRFSAAGLALGLRALFGGAFFLTAYLLVASVQAQGDVKELLLGKLRATGQIDEVEAHSYCRLGSFGRTRSTR